MVLSRWSSWRIWTILVFLYISSSCQASELQTQTTKKPPPPVEVIGNPSFWLKNRHSTTCAKNTVRTFLVDSREGDPLTLIIRQNVQGVVVVKELPKKPASNHKVQLALNWTASSEEVLNALHNSYKVEDVGDEKVVLIQVYVGDVESKTNLSPVVVGGTVTGFLVVMGLIIVALYLARRKSASSVRGGSGGSQDLSSQADEEDDDDEDTDYYHHTSSYMGGEDMSLNLSMMRDGMEVSHETHTGTLNSHPSNHKFSDRQMPHQASVGSMKSVRSRRSGKNEETDLPPPPPPPEFHHEFGHVPPPAHIDDIDGSQPAASSSTINIPHKLSTPSSQTSPHPLYSVPHKQNPGNGRGAPPKFPKPIIAPPKPQSTGSDTDSSSAPPGGGGGSGYLGSSLLGRTVMIVGILSLISHGGYTFCHEDISVEVLIIVPSNAKINGIHLYTNKDEPAVFENTTWFAEHQKLFKTFDIADATNGDDLKPCSPRHTCPTAANQTLLGCDWRTQRCVCERGWEINPQQICKDVDECAMNRCPPEMKCTNYPGTYSCTCHVGTFWNGKQCQSCTIGCPEGLFQSKSCTTVEDRICSPCTSCTGGTFTFKPCTSQRDSQCMDIAQPYIQYTNAVRINQNQVAVESTDNIFLEELHKTQDLSYPMFVSDNNQIMNFVFSRTSGIRVLVKVDNFHIIPDFGDVSHDNDNFFVQRYMPQSKPFLQKIVYNYCRSPVPDYLMLTLNKYRDRTTVVRDIICNSTLKNCPPRFTDGQIYKFRTYNTQCPKTSPEYDSSIEVNKLSNEGNSIVCNERTPLLSDVFNETLRKENPLTFPSVDCKQNIWKCKECFSINRCGDMGEDEPCCGVACHAQRFCKLAAGDECSAAPEECSTGDTVQFIVQPIFENLNNQFLCHLKRRIPKSIFKLSYQVIVPTPDGWNSSRREVELPTTGESSATQRSQYITVKYNNYLDIDVEGEMMLRGDYNNMRREYDFSLFNFKPRSEFNKTKIRPVKYETLRERETLNANFQNERPFDVSTWNFNSGHGCYADTTEIHGKQLMYDNSTGQHVQIYMLKQSDGFTYKARSVKDNETPRIDFYLPANESILYHYFPNSTLDYNSVNVELIDLKEPFYMYSIQVQGHMKSCDSYLGVHVYDKTTESTVAQYDSLIYCLDGDDSSFRFNIKMPDTGSRNKLFAVTLKDSHTSVSYYVTTYSYQSSLIQNNTVSLYTAEGKITSEPAAFFAMLSAMAAIGFAFGLLYVFVSYRCIIIASVRGVEDTCVYNKTRQRLLVTIYFITKVIYSVLFSLSVLVLVLKLVCASDMEQVGQFPTYHIEIKQMVERNIQAITEFKREETQRQNNMKQQRFDACSGYAQESVQSLRSHINSYSTEIRQKKELIENQKFDLLMTEIQKYLMATKEHVDTHKKNTDSQVTDILLEYNTLLEEITTNDWLHIPLNNFRALNNDTKPKRRRNRERLGGGAGASIGGGAGGGAGVVDVRLSEESVNFLEYLGVDRPSAVLRQIQQLNQKLNMMYSMMRMDIDNNIGVEILRGLDTSSISKLSLKKYDSEVIVIPPAFNIEAEVVVKSGGATTIAWIVIIFCDILLFIYRMSAASSTVYRLRQGYIEEIEDNSEPEQSQDVEMKFINTQMNSVGDNEMSRSLLDDAETMHQNKFSEAAVPSSVSYRHGSRAPSEAGSVQRSDHEQPRHPRTSEMGSVGRHSRLSDRPPSAMSEPVSSRSDRMRMRGNSKPASVAGSLRHNPMLERTRQQTPSISSNPSRAQSTDPLGSETRSIEPPPLPSRALLQERSSYDAPTTDAPESGSHTEKNTHPGGCAASRLGRLLLSEYTTPAIMWLTTQVLAIILISLLTELVTYNSMVQVTNIESMISHIGMYASVVNSYLTTHAQAISQAAQQSMVQEFNLHLHHIAKVKAIFETDLNWSMLDYSNKQCVLDGKLIEHCTYDPLKFDFNVMPCQSFPIEAIQYTERAGINAQLVSERMQSFTNSLVSLISTSISMLVFYINAVAIIHIISLVLLTILQQKALLHIIHVKVTRRRVPIIEREEKEMDELPPLSLISDSQRHTSQSPSDVMVNALLAEKRLRTAERNTDRSDTGQGSNNNNNGSVAKIPNDSSLHRRSVVEGGEENDPLLRNIKAQHSLTKQLTDELIESSTRSPRSEPHSDIRGGASFDQRDSETEF